MNWSTDGQSSLFLALTREASLNESIIRIIRHALDLKTGMTILDLGCGSGEYCIRLGLQLNGVRFVGVDFDDAFVDFASRRSRGEVDYPFVQPNPENDYSFVQADGTDLPFDDDTFDAVVSHTYLTAVPDWREALSEMVRVCKPGATISSITNLTDNFYGAGSFDLLSGHQPEHDSHIVQRVAALKSEFLYRMDTVAGVRPHDVPGEFAHAGLDRVRCTPLAHYFCLSDALVSEADSRRHIDLLHAVELEELKLLEKNPAARLQLPDEDWKRYRRLADERAASLIAAIGSNEEWSWIGNASLLVAGDKPDRIRASSVH